MIFRSKKKTYSNYFKELSSPGSALASRVQQALKMVKKSYKVYLGTM